MPLLADMPAAAPSFLVPFLQTIAVTVLIVFLAILTLRYLLPRMNGMRRNKDSQIQVEDYQALDARHAVYILKIKDKRVAVGVTEHNVNKICDL